MDNDVYIYRAAYSQRLFVISDANNREEADERMEAETDDYEFVGEGERLSVNDC